MSNDGDNRLLTVDEVCDRLRISRSALYGLRRDGAAPPAIKIGRQLRFRPTDVDQWISERQPTETWTPAE